MERISLNKRFGVEDMVLSGRSDILFRPVTFEQQSPYGKLGDYPLIDRTYFKVGSPAAISQRHKKLYGKEYFIPKNKSGKINKRCLSSYMAENFIKITELSIIHLHDITEEDCLRSYVLKATNPDIPEYNGYVYVDKKRKNGVSSLFSTPQEAFHYVWNGMMKYLIYAWEENPLVYRLVIQKIEAEEAYRLERQQKSSHFLW